MPATKIFMPEFLPFFIILLAVLIFSELFSRLYIPWVVALVLGGTIIGPFGLDMLSPSEEPAKLKYERT